MWISILSNLKLLRVNTGAEREALIRSLSGREFLAAKNIKPVKLFYRKLRGLENLVKKRNTTLRELMLYVGEFGLQEY